MDASRLRARTQSVLETSREAVSSDTQRERQRKRGRQRARDFVSLRIKPELIKQADRGLFEYEFFINGWLQGVTEFERARAEKAAQILEKEGYAVSFRSGIEGDQSLIWMRISWQS